MFQLQLSWNITYESVLALDLIMGRIEGGLQFFRRLKNVF